MVGHKRVVQPQTPRRIQTSVFRVHIHCDGCKKKVKKLVQKIKGVENIAIDAELGKLTVVGYVSPGTVIKKLEQSGKHAEMWGAYKSSYNLNRMNNQFKNMQIDFYDSGTEKPQHGKSGGHKQVQLATKDRKLVKFEFTDEDEINKREGRDSLDDSDDSFELDFGRDSRKKPGKGSKETKASKGKMKKKKKKKGGFFGIFRLGKKDKNKGNGRKKGSDGGARKSYSREEIYGGKAVGKSFGHIKDGSTGKDYVMNGKNPSTHGGPTHRGKKSEPSFEIDLFDRGKGCRGPGRDRGGGGATGGRLAGQPGHPGGYPSGSAQYEAQGGQILRMPQAQMRNLPSIAPVQYQNHTKLGDPSMNQAGMNFPMNQAGMNFPMNQAGTNFPMNQVPGVPAMTAPNGSGHYPPMGQGGMCNPQFMAMMGQQQAQWNGMAQPMMYGGPNPRPSFSYVLPMAMPARYTDRYTLMFNDENTESCSIM